MHVLSAGEEDTATARVMRECAKLGPGVVIHTDRAALGGDRLQGGRRGVDLVTAGELHLAQDGVLLVNNITSCKQASKVRNTWELKACLYLFIVSGDSCQGVRVMPDSRLPYCAGDEGGSVGLGELLQPPAQGEPGDPCPGHRPHVPPDRPHQHQ